MNDMLSSKYQTHAKQVGWADHETGPDPTKIHLLDSYTRGPRVLEVGCAIGKYTKHLANKFHLTAIDINPTLLAQAHSITPTAHLISASVTHLPFQDKSFDTSIIFDVLEHLDDHQALSELIRVTRRRLIISVPHTTHPDLHQNYLLYGHHQDTTHLRTYTPDSLTHLLHTHHLHIRRLEGSHPLPTDSIFTSIISGHPIQKRIIRKLSYAVCSPVNFPTNLVAIADISQSKKS